jgi:hypothetical protein
MAAAISAPHAGSIASSHPKRMEIQGFVSKKEGVRKAVSQDGYFERKRKKVSKYHFCLAFPEFPSLVRHFIASRRGLYQPSDAISAAFAVSA